MEKGNYNFVKFYVYGSDGLFYITNVLNNFNSNKFDYGIPCVISKGFVYNLSKELLITK